MALDTTGLEIARYSAALAKLLEFHHGGQDVQVLYPDPTANPF